MSDLLVRLKLDDKGLDAQLKGVSSKFADATRSIARIALPVAAIAGIARAVEGLAAIGEAAINTIAPLHDTAQQLGVTAERLQELRAIAGNAGVGVEQFDKALGILNRTLGQTALGQGEFEKIARNAGIALRDEQGHIKGTAQVWDDLTARIQSGSISQNTAIGLASAAFGREGGKMVQVLRQTAEEQQRVIDTARQFGAIISNEVVAAADEYEDQLSLIKQGTEALGAQNDLILAPLTLKWAELKNEISGVVANLALAVGLIDDNLVMMERRLVDIKRLLAEREAFLLKINVDPQSDAFVQNMTRELDNLLIKIHDVKLAAKLAEDNKPPAPTDELEADGLAQIKVKAQQIEAMLSMEQMFARFKQEARDRELKGEQELLENLRAAQAEAFDEELVSYFEKEGLLTEARKQGMQDRLAFDNMEAGQKVATTLGALEQITAGVAQHSRKAFNLNKLAAIANAIVNTAQGATKALAQDGFAGIAMAAAVIAAGTAQIAAIKRTTFQGGGQGTTPSAVGTTATVNGNPVSTSNQIITVRGIDKDQLFTGRQIVELLNEATKNGAKLVLAN